MPTKPRGFYTLEQRDALITEMYDKQSEMHDHVLQLSTEFKGFLETHEKCQRSQCKAIEDNDRDLRDFKRDVIKISIGFGSAIVIALVGVIAVLL